MCSGAANACVAMPLAASAAATVGLVMTHSYQFSHVADAYISTPCSGSAAARGGAPDRLCGGDGASDPPADRSCLSQNCRRKLNVSVGLCTVERRWHVSLPLAGSAAAMALLAGTMGEREGLAFASLLAAALAWAPGGILSAYPSSYLSGPAAASGWAVINAVGALLGGVTAHLQF